MGEIWRQIHERSYSRRSRLRETLRQIVAEHTVDELQKSRTMQSVEAITRHDHKLREMWSTEVDKCKQHQVDSSLLRQTQKRLRFPEDDHQHQESQRYMSTAPTFCPRYTPTNIAANSTRCLDDKDRLKGCVFPCTVIRKHQTLFRTTNETAKPTNSGVPSTPFWMELVSLHLPKTSQAHSTSFTDRLSCCILGRYPGMGHNRNRMPQQHCKNTTNTTRCRLASKRKEVITSSKTTDRLLRHNHRFHKPNCQSGRTNATKTLRHSQKCQENARVAFVYGTTCAWGTHVHKNMHTIGTTTHEGYPTIHKEIREYTQSRNDFRLHKLFWTSRKSYTLLHKI